MELGIVFHPRELVGRDLSDACCVVIDLLRATTTMTTAIANDAREIRVFSDLEDAQSAHAAFNGAKLLAGERRCLPPAGFDLGNSPGDFTSDRVKDATIFLSTTNGTRAVLACANARITLVAALVNASATALAISKLGHDVVFVCAGVDGVPGGEDIDAAATIGEMVILQTPASRPTPPMKREIADASWLGNRFDAARLRATPGGKNLIAAGLERDIAFSSQIDFLDCVCVVSFLKMGGVVSRLGNC